LFQTRQEVASPVYSSQRSQNFPMYYHRGVKTPPPVYYHKGVKTPRRIHHRGVVLDTGNCFTDFEEHTTIVKGNVILKIDCRLL
jgi:hypothetical protein